MTKKEEEKRFNLTAKEVKELVEELATKVVKEVLADNEKKDFWEMTPEERKAEEEKNGFCVVEDVDGEGYVCFSKARNAETNELEGLAIRAAYTNENGEYEEYEDILVLDKEDACKIHTFLTALLEEMK